MTSRERVVAALEHREPDKVPIDLGGMRSTGMLGIAYARFTKHIGLTSGATRIYDTVQQLAQPEDAVLDYFAADVVDLGRAFLDRDEDWHPWTLPDGTAALAPFYFRPERDGGDWVTRHADGSVIGRMPPGCFYFNQEQRPLREWDDAKLKHLPELMSHVTWAAMPSPPWYLSLDEPGLAEMRRRARKLRSSTGRAIMAAFGGNLLEWGQFLCGVGEFLMMLAERPDRAERLLDALTELHLSNLPKFLGAVGDCIDLVQMGDDLGMQTGPQISPAMYRRFFLPRHRAIYAAVKKHSRAFVFLHSCGSVAALIPDLIEAGVDVINPVQTSAAGMEPARLKAEFGREMAFWGGGCDTQAVLPRGTPEQVRDEVRRNIEAFAPGGGYIFCQVHNITAEVPPENIVAMVEAAHEWRQPRP
jgi:uroporphyrinogen decarboxylase